LSEDTEAELVFQLREGSTEAYQQLLDRHLASINRYVVRMMGNTIDSDDITQEVFIRLWEKSYQFNPEVAKLSTWLH
jgi:RNA polymerase sigma-70 factor (ECF subfamily)